MKSFSIPLFILIAVSVVSCRKDGLKSAMARRIQYRWEYVNSASSINYLDGRDQIWTRVVAQPGNYFEYRSDGYAFSKMYKYEYKVDGDKILSLMAGVDRFTTPRYTDTATIKEVNDHLLVLYRRKYYISGAYAHLTEYIDSLKR